jgi:hypothetical protein
MFRQTGEDIDCSKSLLLAKMCTRLKKIISVRKGTPWLDFKKLYIFMKQSPVRLYIALLSFIDHTHEAGLLSTSDQLVTEAATCTTQKNAREEHP